MIKAIEQEEYTDAREYAIEALREFMIYLKDDLKKNIETLKQLRDKEDYCGNLFFYDYALFSLNDDITLKDLLVYLDTDHVDPAEGILWCLEKLLKLDTEKEIRRAVEHFQRGISKEEQAYKAAQTFLEEIRENAL